MTRAYDIVEHRLAETIEPDNMLAQSRVSLDSAVGWTKSRGALTREDFPRRDERNWPRQQPGWLDDATPVRLDHRPAAPQPSSNEVASIPPEERVY